MKKQQLKEIKTAAVAELKSKLRLYQKELASLVLDKNSKKLKDIKAVYKKRKDIAQVLTILRQKELLKKMEAKV
ncbi:50S ribosomal protein L29 [Candidatus Daviesbacteria bacterium]|nr:50S ribosomal protein L29 [Candidatus Daviesbacteria bacterium]